MNSCILIAKIVRRPELRYTQDTQTPYTQMLVEFDSRRSDEPPGTLKVVAWRNLASEIADNYDEGDQVIIEGRLSMQMIDRPEGFKEKRAELIISHIHPLNEKADTTTSMTSEATAVADEDKVVSMNSFKHKSVEPKFQDEYKDDDTVYESSKPSVQTVPASVEQDLDDIPF